MKTQSQQKLFSPLKVGPLTLSHRVVMAPLTRMRSQQPGDIPSDLMVEYYGQRASQGGLIISEATTISVGGRGYLGAPGIYSDEQIAGWKKVVDAIHAKGGYNAAVADGLPPVAAGELRKVFEGNILAAGGFEPDSAETIIETGDADFVAFGRHCIANPDLPQRIQKVLPLTPYDRTTFYEGDARGYTDYPAFEEQRTGTRAQPSASGR